LIPRSLTSKDQATTTARTFQRYTDTASTRDEHWGLVLVLVLASVAGEEACKREMEAALAHGCRKMRGRSGVRACTGRESRKRAWGGDAGVQEGHAHALRCGGRWSPGSGMR
jgi:hypothetical protein